MRFCHLSFLDLRKLYFQTGVDNNPTVFLFNDTQILDESFLEDINNVLSSGEVPNLYKPDEFEEASKITSMSFPPLFSVIFFF